MDTDGSNPNPVINTDLMNCEHIAYFNCNLSEEYGLVDLPPFNSMLKSRKFVPKHDGAFSPLDNLFYGFSGPFRDLVANDVTPSVKSKFHRAISEILRFQGKKRIIAEYSGWSRISAVPYPQIKASLMLSGTPCYRNLKE